METKLERSKIAVVFLASRPKFLTASVAPILVGSALGYAVSSGFNLLLFAFALLAIMLLQGGANIVNDYFDHTSGNDWVNKNPTPFSGGRRFIQEGILSPGTTLLAGIAAMLIASAIGVVIVLLTKSMFILVLGLIGLFGGYFYTASPIRLGYHSIGEVIIGFLFGLLPVCGAYYLQTGVVDSIALLPGIIVGLLIFLIILVNEFPDADADAAVNKKTLVVKFGVTKAVWIYRTAVAAGYIAAIAIIMVYRNMFWAGLLYLFTLPIGIAAIKFVNKEDMVKPGQLKPSQITILLHTVGSLAITVGFIITGLRI